MQRVCVLSTKSHRNINGPAMAGAGDYHEPLTQDHALRRFIAQGRWNGMCKITSVKTNLVGNIYLPKLVGANAAQSNQFEKYLSALRIHELGHYNIGKEVATTIDRKILSLPEMSSCKVLEATANDFGL